MLAHADLDGEEQVFPEAKPRVAAKGSDGVARFPSTGDVYKILIEKACTSDEGSGSAYACRCVRYFIA